MWHVYRLRQCSTGKAYIGVTANAHARLLAHKSQRPWVRAGDYSFKVIAAFADKADAMREETALIIAENTLHPYGFNHFARGSNEGRVFAAEHRARIAAALRGKKMDPAAIAKMAASKTGIRQTAEHVAKRVAGRAGYSHAPETKAKIGAANKGTVHSEAFREQCRQRQLGKKQSPETIAKRTASRLATLAKRKQQIP